MARTRGNQNVDIILQRLSPPDNYKQMGITGDTVFASDPDQLASTFRSSPSKRRGKAIPVSLRSLEESDPSEDSRT
ncbi:hypothetical protein HHK36_030579 [Tetracentron sinense]|uniref:Uncharacterized protein n=1 Tax=Tetracentron sinense TaxID=13715 RepID=A0A834YCE4_TETSI|nr:hypothetical protein HHK36_030579 [Tetracentron sinense]